MTVSELIEWLKTQDQGATVEVLQLRQGGAWEGDSVTTVDFNPDEHADYTDFRGNKFAKGKPYENQRTLLLGND
jgi:hypothetical protein